MNARPTEQLLQAIAVTAELTGTQLSKPAASVMAQDLAEYPEQQVMKSLTRCRRELRGRLTIAEVIARLEDGRPGPEEAWAMIPRGEEATIVWTDEMRTAWAAAQPLIAEDDLIAGRMAFLESYRAALATARADHSPVKWTASLGFDVRGREQALRDAVELGRLPAGTAAALCYTLREEFEAAGLLEAPEAPTLLEQRDAG